MKKEEFRTFQANVVEDRQPSRLVMVLGGGAISLVGVTAVFFGIQTAIERQDAIHRADCDTHYYTAACSEARRTANQSHAGLQRPRYE